MKRRKAMKKRSRIEFALIMLGGILFFAALFTKVILPWARGIDQEMSELKNKRDETCKSMPYEKAVIDGKQGVYRECDDDFIAVADDVKKTEVLLAPEIVSWEITKQPDGRVFVEVNGVKSPDCIELFAQGKNDHYERFIEHSRLEKWEDKVITSKDDVIIYWCVDEATRKSLTTRLDLKLKVPRK